MREPGDKPDSVVDGHLSMRPTWDVTSGSTLSTLGLAPDGVYRAAAVACDAGGLLHHRFTLACDASRRPSAVCSLLHCPSGRPAWPLASIVPCGVRTFLNVTARSDAATVYRARAHEPYRSRRS